jgi:hypothetical protein
MKTGFKALTAALFVLGCGDASGVGDAAKQVPPPPPSITATVVNGNNIEITWAKVEGATKYNVYMASSTGVTKLNFRDLPGNMFHPGEVVSFDHPPGLTLNDEWFFIVTAVNEAGESRESCEASAVIAASKSGTC